jgi:hypothetical protein
MSALCEGAAILGLIILVLAIFAAASILGGFLSLLGIIILVGIGIKAVREL